MVVAVATSAAIATTSTMAVLDRHPPPPQITFLSFDGEFDPLTWVNKCDNYFRGHPTLEEEKWMASLHLDRATANWYYQVE